MPKGIDLLRDPSWNKGTAFTMEERHELDLIGLLPPYVNSQDEQIVRVLQNFRRKSTPLEKYIYLINLQLRNEMLFYRVIIDNIDEMMKIIYTPTVGMACEYYGMIFQRSLGLYIMLNDKGNIREILQNWYKKEPRVIVVTDGERILGLGDLGTNGMGIPVGKLALYTACAGIDPSVCLPITLDVGTNNEELLDDPFYIGVKQYRVRGEEYDEFIDEFMSSVKEIFPRCLIQFEDFANLNAFRLLDKYWPDYCTFNDDIQGTGSVALAGLFSAMRITKQKITEQKILFLGAGEAGLGIGDMIVAAMVDEGMDIVDALKRCWFVDSKGLIVEGRDHLNDHKLKFAHPHEKVDDLLGAVKALKPTAIVGVSGMKQSFTQEIIEQMSSFNERPIIFALSNPTSKAECTAEQAYQHSKGKAIFASGSPFGPVEYEGQSFVTGQGNNAYIFPGVGLGVLVCDAKTVPNEMFFTAAKTLASQVSQDDLDKGRIYPSLSEIRRVSLAIAEEVMKIAYRLDIARAPKPDDMKATIESQMYEPNYRDYV
jgi:malate dehydrogenase (oxaloacetate-decarboxylating)(NADP+)